MSLMTFVTNEKIQSLAYLLGVDSAMCAWSAIITQNPCFLSQKRYSPYPALVGTQPTPDAQHNQHNCWSGCRYAWQIKSFTTPSNSLRFETDSHTLLRADRHSPHTADPHLSVGTDPHPSFHGILVPCAPSRWACLTLDDSTAPTCLCYNRFWPTCSPLTPLGSLIACLRGPNPILDIWQLPSLFLHWSTTMLKLELRMLMAFPLVSFNFAMLIKPF